MSKWWKNRKSHVAIRYLRWYKEGRGDEYMQPDKIIDEEVCEG